MIELTGKDDGLVQANEIRDNVFKYLPLILEAPHSPTLNEEQKNKVIEKLVFLANEEYRSGFYLCSLTLTASLRPGTGDSPTKLSPLVLKWAGLRKILQYKEPTQQIKGAKNGRVLRSGKSL
jgi:hypothetical protein